LGFHLPFQFGFVVLNGGESLNDSGAFDDFFDVVTGGFFGIEEDVDFVDPAEEVVEVPHDVLIGTHKEEAEVIRFGGLGMAVDGEGMEGQSIADILEVDEFPDLPIGIASDVDESRFVSGPFVEPAERHDGEELSPSPVIDEGLEDGEVAEVLVSEAVFEFLDFFGDVVLSSVSLKDGLADFPV